MMDWKRCGRIAIVVINCFAAVGMLYIIAGSAEYTVLIGDDFTHGVRVGAFQVPFFQYLAASIQYMKEIYLDWQGTYFAMLIQALCLRSIISE